MRYLDAFARSALYVVGVGTAVSTLLVVPVVVNRRQLARQKAVSWNFAWNLRFTTFMYDTKVLIMAYSIPTLPFPGTKTKRSTQRARRAMSAMSVMEE